MSASRRSPARRWIVGGAVLALGASTLLAANAQAEPERAAAPQPSAVVFIDDFDGPAGSGVDTGKWRLDPGDNINNNELQYYTEGTENAQLDGEGNLVITATAEGAANYQCYYGTCEYTSARMNTSQTFQAEYGRVEASIKLPQGQGIWPAFWMLGSDFPGVPWPDSGEIDIMEMVGHQPGTVHGTVHGPGYSGGAGIGSSYSLPGGEIFADDFHTFAIDWAPDSIVWSVDGNVFQELTPGDLGGNAWVFNKPFFMILNLAVGGDWPGPPDDGTSFPQQMIVDYVSVTTSD
ncbi:glycoside hydrolase family 16 protein [Streptomyces profundus]|uniref:glycoside hydrolase family 16 protein n=1 Tax=Streptomyces profundus TaxID=2867410 RepID=UPI001D169810|nr:glycoside hydrolase family 16 protein [Streptomyces sp. MA3_2.13]